MGVLGERIGGESWGREEEEGHRGEEGDIVNKRQTLLHLYTHCPTIYNNILIINLTS